MSQLDDKITVGDEQYIITDKILGKGGFGEVRVGYKMKNGKIDDKTKYAIKIIEDIDEDDIEREIRMLKAIKHRCEKDFLCYYGDVRQNEKHYIVMEYVDGVPFNSESGSTYPLTLDIMKDCLQALSTLHKMGIIHRDIKPENMMIIDKEGKKKVKYLDWGISCINEYIEEDDEDDEDDEKYEKEAPQKIGKISDCRGKFGTHSYMDPQLFIERKATPFSDIYSLGVVFYELFVGELIYDNFYLQTIVDENGKPILDEDGDEQYKPYEKEDNIKNYEECRLKLQEKRLEQFRMGRIDLKKIKEINLMEDIISDMIIPPFDPEYKKPTADDLLEKIWLRENELSKNAETHLS
jgi:serine/threonine protein kinase